VPPKEQPKHSKLADVERLRLIRYNTKGPGAKRAPAKPSIEKLRNDVAKVVKKKLKPRRRTR
jgi:hypothetical protein